MACQAVCLLLTTIIQQQGVIVIVTTLITLPPVQAEAELLDISQLLALEESPRL